MYWRRKPGAAQLTTLSAMSELARAVDLAEKARVVWMGKRGGKSDAENPLDAEVGRRIEAARKKARWGSVRLAAALEITSQMLYAYEIGRIRCSPYRLRVTAKVLGVPVESLIPDR